MICLETSFIVDYLRENPDDSTDLGPAGTYLATNEAETFAISALTLHEVFFGDVAMRSDGSAETAMDRSATALGFADVLPYDSDIARESAVLRAELRNSGDMIPLPDAFIAATARHYGYPLVCADKHFDLVSDLNAVHYK